jgi:hypothetical protein
MTPTSPTPRRWRQRIAVVSRWLHIYTSVLGLGAVLFFSVTGITLNHPDWSFGFKSREHTVKTTISPALLGAAPNELGIVEHLRREHGLHGGVDEFRTEDDTCSISFKGPGYSADVTIQRAGGECEIFTITEGPVALLNDLHKGRYTGRGWSLVIDITAAVLILISVSGLILLLYIKRRRRSGLVTAILGTALVAALAWWLVP